MNAYIYCADLYCADCGQSIRQTLDRQGKAPASRDNESSYDSSDYPKGPFHDGGGEADCPQHCGSCGMFLENPLTSDGLDYVRQAIDGPGKPEVLADWRAFYGDQLQLESA